MQGRTFSERYIVRMPDGWRDAIKARAAQNRRSMNQEILSALECALGVAAGGDLAGQTPAAGTVQATNHHKEHHHE